MPGRTSYTLDEAFEQCAAITRAHYENFPVASLFLPDEKRPYIQAVYAFSRIADDIADEGTRPAGDRLADLDAWEQQLESCYNGAASHPVFIALAETVRQLEIPRKLLIDLLSAFRQDVLRNRYETFEDVMAYCRLSANPVGRIVLWIFGYRQEELAERSDDICTALQLANFWQDVAIDRDKDRMYLPLEDLHRFRYREEEWRRGVVDDRFRDLLKFEVMRTRDLFVRGSSLPAMVEKDLQIELRLVWFGGMAVLRALHRNRYDVYRRRPYLTAAGKLAVLFRGLFYRDLERFGKRQQPKEPWDLT